MEAFTGEAHGNATVAAQLADYGGPRQAGSRLLKREDAQAAIQARRALIAASGPTEAERSKIADAAERRERLTVLVRAPDSHPLTVIKATDVLNKMDGLYVGKAEAPLVVPVSLLFLFQLAPSSETRT